MAKHRINPQRIKLHRSYTVPELAKRLGVHKGTIRLWRQGGLQPIDGNRPAMFQGSNVRAYLVKRNASRKRPCQPGQLFCVRCREPRQPVPGLLDYLAATPVSGNLRAPCGTCGAIMHRRIRRADLAAKMPELEIQIREAGPRISGSLLPPQNCDSEGKAES
jgi:hypothetical protein